MKTKILITANHPTGKHPPIIITDTCLLDEGEKLTVSVEAYGKKVYIYPNGAISISESREGVIDKTVKSNALHQMQMALDRLKDL